MINLNQGAFILFFIIGLTFIATAVPVLVWWVFDTNPDQPDKKSILLIVFFLEATILVLIGYILGEFFKGLLCMAFGMLAFPILFTFGFAQYIYMDRVIMPLRIQYINDFVNFLQRKKFEKQQKRDSVKKNEPTQANGRRPPVH